MTALHIVDDYVPDLVPLEALEAADQPATLPPSSTNLPDEFWNRRPVLDHIRQAAYSAMVAPEAVLGCVLAKVAVRTPPAYRLPAIVGSAGSLNLAVTLEGRPGVGKSQAKGVADRLFTSELLPVAGVEWLGPSSGEGLVDAYHGHATNEDGDKVYCQTRHSISFFADEGEALLEVATRAGATLLPTIRSAWSGSDLGQANASADRKRHLPAHAYRFVLVIGIQPDKAGPLLDETAGGTAQRFLTFTATNATIPEEPVDWPGPIDWTPPVNSAAPVQLTADQRIVDQIRTARLARVRGEAVDIQAHTHLSQLKTAGLLAILDNRTHITEDDWQLVQQIHTASEASVDVMKATIAATAKVEEAKRSYRLAARQVEASRAVDGDAESRALEAIARAVANKAHRTNGGLTNREASRSTAGKHRALASVDDGINLAVERGWVTIEDGLIVAGETRPT